MRWPLFLTLVLVGGACDTAGEAGTDQDGHAALTTGGAASSSTSHTSAGGASSETGATASGGVATAGATVTTSAMNSETSGTMSTNGAGTPSSGGTSNTGSGGSAGGGSGGQDTSVCDDPGLVWKSGRKTNYTSYPDPNSEECVVYNGCMWAGWFAHCDEQQSEAWVASHDIAAMFPDSGYELHDICLRSGERTMIVTVYDTCGDDDCDGCCTENKGDADALIDLESFTNARWGLPDGDLTWADLGRTADNSCE